MTWGHKVSIVVYVEGDLEEGARALFAASDAACDVLVARGVKIDNAGVTVDAVEERPMESGGT